MCTLFNKICLVLEKLAAARKNRRTAEAEDAVGRFFKHLPNRQYLSQIDEIRLL